MVAFMLALVLVALCLVQAAWLSFFALDLFFDTSRTTAAERARTILRYVAFLLTVQIGIVVIGILILYAPPDFLRGS